MIWIVDIPPEYDGLEISAPAITYILHNKPSETLLALVSDRGGSITSFEDPFSGTGNIYVWQDDEDTDLTDLGDGDYSFDPYDQYETDIWVTLEDESGESYIDINYTLYQPYNIVREEGVALPLYGLSANFQTVYQIDNETGATLWSVNDSDYAGIADGDDYIETCNFVCTNNGYLFFTWTEEIGIPIETHLHLVVIDPDGTPTELMDANVGQHTAMLAYDSSENFMYLEIDEFPTDSDTTLYTFSEIGAFLGSAQRERMQYDAMAAYNGVLSYLYRYDGTTYLTCGGTVRFSMADISTTDDLIAAKDGYVYFLYEDSGTHLVKVDPEVGEVWTYDFHPAATLEKKFRNLWVNDSGYSMVPVDIYGTKYTYKVYPDGDGTFWSGQSGIGIDNNQDFFD